jgi:hypothetical protein
MDLRTYLGLLKKCPFSPSLSLLSWEGEIEDEEEVKLIIPLASRLESFSISTAMLSATLFSKLIAGVGVGRFEENNFFFF